MADKMMTVGDQVVVFDDCKNMKLEDGSIDVAVTSPPYNIGKDYVSADGSKGDDALPIVEYRHFLYERFKQVHRVLAKDGVFFINVGDPASFDNLSQVTREVLQAAGFVVKQRIVWVKSILGKGHFTPSGGTRRFDDVWETIWLCTKHKKNYRLDTKRIGVPYTDRSNVGRYGDSNLRDPSNVWFMPYEKTTGHKDKKGHPSPYPVEIPYRCIKAVPDAKTVLDPFCGLGTTLQAARLLGLKGYGYELYPWPEKIAHKIAVEWSPEPYIAISHLESAVRELYKGQENLSPETADVLKNLGVTV